MEQAEAGSPLIRCRKQHQEALQNGGLPDVQGARWEHPRKDLPGVPTEQSTCQFRVTRCTAMPSALAMRTK